MIANVLAILVVLVAVPIQWYVAWRLWTLHRSSPGIRVLRERGIVATALASITTIFGLVFLNNGMDVPVLDVEATRILTRAAMLALVVPSLYWWWMYRTAR